MRKHLPYIGFLIAFLGIFFYGMNMSDILGHDYFFTFPRLLTGNWHFAHQGLKPFLYTPQLCGGLPIYANPQDMFYSLPQFLSFIMDPWRAVLLSLCMTMVVGYTGWYRVGKDILRLPLRWAHVLALVIVANGYYFMHMLIGHIVFHTIPLIGWGLWLLFDPRTDTRKTLALRSCAFAALLAVMLYSGGYFVIVLLMGTVLIALTFDLLLSSNPQKRCKTLGARLLMSASLGLFLCLSKLIAVLSYMRFFPRETPFDTFPKGASTIGFFFKSLWAIPQNTALFTSVNMPDWGAIHEYSRFTSPIVLVGLLLGIWFLWKQRKAIQQNTTRSLLLLGISVALMIFFVQLIRGYGLLVTPLETVPFFSSWHVMLRFMYIPIVFLSGISIWTIAQSPWNNNRFAFTAIGITLFSAIFAYAPMLQSKDFGYTVPYPQIQENIRTSNYRSLITERVESIPGVSDTHGIFNGSTATPCYEPVYWGTGGVQLDPLFIGTVDGLFEEQFNMYNPACLVYPEANDCIPGDRIALEDYSNLVAFTHGEPTTWKVSGWQSLGNLLSIATLLIIIILMTSLCVARIKSCTMRE
jgi:hypothetical protein